MNQKIQVLKSFKNLLKTRKLVFGEDKRMLYLSRNQIFEEYRKNKNVKNSDEIKDMISAAEEASKFLLFGIAQGKKQDGGDNYSVHLTKEQTKEYIDSELTFKPINEENLK